MNYPENNQVLYTVACFFILGVIGAAIYSFLSILLSASKRLFSFWGIVSEYRSGGSLSSLRMKIKNNLLPHTTPIYQSEVLNFIFIILLAYWGVMLNYILLDGEFRLYIPIILVAGFLISIKVINKYLAIILSVLFEYIYLILSLLVCFILSFFNFFNKKATKK